MKKTLFTLFILLMSFTLVACNTSDDTDDEKTDGNNNEQVDENKDDNKDENTDENKEDENTADESNEGTTDEGTEENVGSVESDFSVQVGQTETITVEIEGMEDEKEVKTFTLLPYNIEYQLYDILGEPSINENDVATYNNGFIKVSVQVIEDGVLDDVVAKQLEGKEVEVKEDTSNEFTGKSHDFGTTGFVAYEIDGNVLLATYEHSEEAGDGFGAIFNHFKESVSLVE